MRKDNLRVFEGAKPKVDEPVEVGSVYCTSCGSHAFRLTISDVDVPYGVRCFNCNNPMDITFELPDEEDAPTS